MANNKYRPDYSALYPGLDIQANILRVLRKSDRKMEYMEVDLKVEQPIKSEEERNPRALPAREDSYDRLLEIDQEFSGGEATPEQRLMRKTEKGALWDALAQLKKEEQELIKHLFCTGLTERETAKIVGVTHVAVHKRKRKILGKLKRLLNS